MLKYYGTPITPQNVFKKYFTGKKIIVSYHYKSMRVIENSKDFIESYIIDNGAFSFYLKQIKPDWDDFYNWLETKPERDFFFIPDVIDGSEKENDSLIKNCPFPDGVPVFHLHENKERLKKLMSNFEYIAFGSSGEFWEIGSYKWFVRMEELMRIVCNSKGEPLVKIHMLRCLNSKIFTKFPFYSGDSTGLARNHKRDGIEKLLNSIEPYNSPKKYTFKGLQMNLFGGAI